MQRTDRSNSALRPLSISQGVLSRSDGSAQFSFGDVSVLTSVTGPVEVRLNKELVDQSTLEFNSTSLSSQSGPQVKATEETLSKLFKPLILTHLYPRSLIQLTSQTTSLPSTSFSSEFSTTLVGDPSEPTATKRRRKGGLGGMGEIAARINSTSLALIDSGVQLKGILVSVSVAYLESQDEEEEEMRLDPSVFEEEEAKSCHLFTVSYGEGVGGTEGTVVGIESRGKFNQDQLFKAEDVALTATSKILAFVRKSIEAKYGVENQPVAPTTTTRNEGGGMDKEIKMCVAEEGDDMSDDGDDDQVMI